MIMLTKAEHDLLVEKAKRWDDYLHTLFRDGRSIGDVHIKCTEGESILRLVGPSVSTPFGPIEINKTEEQLYSIRKHDTIRMSYQVKLNISHN